MSIEQKTETFFINRFHGRFSTIEAAEEDEKMRRSSEWIIDRVVGTFYEHETSSLRVIDDTKAPFTGQPEGMATVYLFKDLIKRMKEAIQQHGDLVGYTDHHCGRGIYSREMVIVKQNENHVLATEHVISR